MFGDDIKAKMSVSSIIYGPVRPLLYEPTSGKAAILVFTACLLFFIGQSLRIVCFHPLARFPGPPLAIVSNLFYSGTVISGHSHTTIKKLRDNPRKGTNIFVKNPHFYPTDGTIRAKHIVNTSDPVEHAQIRKMMSHAFSQKALFEQEDIVIHYADMLMTAILDESREGLIDLEMFYNWTTFHVLGELASGEPFGSLEARKTDNWITIILMMMIKWNAYDFAIHKLPFLPRIQSWLVPKDIAEGAEIHIMQSKRKILERMNRPNDRLDFVSYIFKKREEIGITDWEMTAHANALVIARSETTATVVSGLTYWLCRTPRAYEKLKRDVRCTFTSSTEITSRSAMPLTYLTACIDEAFRIYPPISIAMPRKAPAGGETVAGYFVPEGTTVAVHMWSTTHNPKNFKDPYEYRPERWMEPNNTDNLDASKPFLLGPRACMGQNMAWMELRILIAKLVFLFDFKLDDDDFDWDRDSRTFVLWEKPPLMTRVTPRAV
ncbi:cytochrome P450 [Mytilinidion resinicola]|uniref:Cytochrome P450 n=1 Tax=Mytilinidion resinicola TaxID=574789 RepID=A0A6A6Z148_9PEZI|nr:cytochrome P450 [Mytilinidion resinicola]KAF2814750.1 cytochrome P450 [Mytilinidion resinicola]